MNVHVDSTSSNAGFLMETLGLLSISHKQSQYENTIEFIAFGALEIDCFWHAAIRDCMVYLFNSLNKLTYLLNKTRCIDISTSKQNNITKYQNACDLLLPCTLKNMGNLRACAKLMLLPWPIKDGATFESKYQWHIKSVAHLNLLAAFV